MRVSSQPTDEAGGGAEALQMPSLQALSEISADLRSQAGNATSSIASKPFKLIFWIADERADAESGCPGVRSG